MDQYTDDERVEDLKKWWKENGASIITGITLGVIAIFAWQYWLSHRDAKAEQASQAYDAFIEAAEKPDAEQARQHGQALLVDFPKSSYSTLAALRLAKLAIDSGDNATAIQRLEWVIDNAKLNEFKDIARLRLARILASAGRFSDAEQRLNQITTNGLTTEREELRGDLALAANDPVKARTAYAAAQAASGGGGLLQLKLESLNPPAAESLIPAPAAPLPDVQADAARPSDPAQSIQSTTESAPQPDSSVETGSTPQQPDVHSVVPSQPAAPSQPAETVAPSPPVHPADTVAPAQPVEPVQPAETAAPPQSAEPLQPAEPVEKEASPPPQSSPPTPLTGTSSVAPPTPSDTTAQPIPVDSAPVPSTILPSPAPTAKSNAPLAPALPPPTTGQ